MENNVTRIIGFLIALIFSTTTLSSIAPKQVQDAHSGHKAHAEKSEHGDNGKQNNPNLHSHHGAVTIKKEDLGLFEVKVMKVGSGQLNESITIPGEVTLNQNSTTHVVPRISGVVKKVHKNIGEKVKKGDLLATLESMDLADVKAQYLSYLEVLQASKEIYELIENLKKQGITYTKEYLDSKVKYVEARINAQNTKQKLLIYGLSEADVAKMDKDKISEFMKYEVRSPVDGVVLERHISIGEFIKDDTSTMTIANLDDVWIDFSIFQDDFPFVKKGTEVTVSPRHRSGNRKYHVSYASPIVNETTRTGLARIIASNKDNAWRPGEFIQGTVVKKSKNVDILIPKAAVQNIKGKQVVFLEDVAHKGIFFPQEIVLGERGDDYFEVLSGLNVGDKIVSQGAFILKAQASKSDLESGHNH